MRPHVYLHPLSPTSPPILVLALLEAHLPTSITLLQRLETALQAPPHPQHRAQETYLLATFPTSNPPPGPPEATSSQQPFTIALAARTAGADIDVQLYSSIDALSPPPSTRDEIVCAEQVLAVLAKFRALAPLPRRQHAASAAAVDGEEITGDGASSSSSSPTERHPATQREEDDEEEDLLLLGCVHAHTAAALRSHTPSLLPSYSSTTREPRGFTRDDISGPGGPFNKWLLTPPSTPTRCESPLPPGLAWSTVRPGADRAQVMRSNAYVRKAEVLEGLACAAIRSVGDCERAGEGELAAWAFRSLDGSVRTVHCEEVWRRRGLAGLVVRKVLLGDDGCGSGGALVRRARVDGDGGVDNAAVVSRQQQQRRLGHTNIYPGNLASERLFQQCAGAELAYQVYWMRVDVGVLRGF